MPKGLHLKIGEQGGYFERTIAFSIQARYIIQYYKKQIPIDAQIPIEHVLPEFMIPNHCKKRNIGLKGVVQLKNQFNIYTNQSILPKDAISINAPSAEFGDLILPLCSDKDAHF